MTLLLEFDAVLTQQDSNGNIASHYAAMFGRTQIMKWLWSNGVEINQTNQFGETPLHFACRSGAIELIQFLLSRNHDATQLTKSERTPIFYAAESGKLDVVQFLVKNGCDIHHLDKNSSSLLHIAAQLGNFDMIKYLVEQKINVNIQTILFFYLFNNDAIIISSTYEIPIFIAAHNKFINIVEFLAKHGADCMIQDSRQYSLLEYAVLMDSLKLCNLFIDMNVTFQIDKAFLLSSLLGKHEIFQLFLENNADTSVVGEVLNITLCS